jgi:hypothetical protein
MAPATLRRAGTRSPSAKPLILLTVAAVLLLVALPIAILVALFMIVFGHVASGFAVIGISILVSAGAVVLAGASGVRHLRRIVDAKSFRVVRLGQQDYRYGSAAEDCVGCGHDHSQDGPPRIV